ncbi:MAG: A/G-specific adenine glycosylase [Bacteroidetes bacterium]|jgi:A/G-specific adenine glycosylase|nr:A/G-specific adenine glycosylase [Bacteroidota bacterium]
MDRIQKFSRTLLRWHDSENDRQMPWKGESDPYKIWLSEIILQQTRVAQGEIYYKKFLSAFPKVQDLANSSLDKVLKLWEGLGYYSRARNLHFTARYITHERNGVFPNSYEGLLKLKGVGPYTASAISSFAFDLPHPVLDGNSLRLVTRFENCDIPINEQRGKDFVQLFLTKAIPHYRPGDFNQAIMDFGAIVCKPKQPLCKSCPLQNDCKAFKYNTSQDLPVKKKAKPKRHRYFHFFHLQNQNTILLEKRQDSDIWKELYQLPLLERPNRHPPAPKKLAQHLHLPADAISIEFLRSSTQTLSHQYIHAYFYLCTLDRDYRIPERFQWVAESDLPEYGFPKIVRDFFNRNQRTLL